MTAGRAASPDAGQGVAAGMRVTRSRQPAWWLTPAAIVVVAVFAFLPYLVYEGTTNELVNVFILMAMASMWNLLAGYAGLVSVGQQAFVGLGAYFVLILAQHRMNPFLALPVAAVACGVIAVPVWLLVFRLRGGYFAIATWVVASVCNLIVIRFPSLGGNTGVSLPGLSGLSGTLLGAYTYWVSLVVVVAVVAAVFLIMRSRFGLVLTAVRDDEVGARSAGARVSSARRLVFLVAAIGCGAAGGLLIISELNVEPSAAFAVSLSAQMIFATIIGGIGTVEGPIIGSIVFFALQHLLSSYGAWYWIIFGLVAITVAMWAPRGLWGTFSDLTGIRLFPVGYWLWLPGAPRRPPLLRFPARRQRAAPDGPAPVGAAPAADTTPADAAPTDAAPTDAAPTDAAPTNAAPTVAAPGAAPGAGPNRRGRRPAGRARRSGRPAG